MFNQIYQNLKANFNQRRFKFLFKYTALGRLLSQEEPPSPSVFFDTYRSSWWWNRLWFRSCIQDQTHLASFDVLDSQRGNSELSSALYVLKTKNILTPENFDVLANHAAPLSLAHGLVYLHHAHILTSVNRTALANHAHPSHLANGLLYLYYAGILTSVNRTALANHAEPRSLADGLLKLHQADILTPVNRTALATHADPSSLADGLLYLHQADILTPDNRTALTTHAEPRSLADGLIELHLAGILTQDNLKALATHAEPLNLARGLLNLHQAGILNHESKTLLAMYAKPLMLSRGLREIHDRNGLLACTSNPRSIVIGADDNKTFMQLRRLLPEDLRAIATYSACHDARESALNVIIANWLHIRERYVPQIMQFLEQNTLKAMALKYIADIPFPESLDHLAAYKEALDIRTSEFILKAAKQELTRINGPITLAPEAQAFLDAHRSLPFSLWAKRQESAELQHTFDKQYGLSIIP